MELYGRTIIKLHQLITEVHVKSDSKNFIKWMVVNQPKKKKKKPKKPPRGVDIDSLSSFAFSCIYSVVGQKRINIQF